jgi:hypothetical protein|nr:MAG TPA: Protein of unknown function (DUF551) [Caudoviricetes sp.]
MSKTIEEAAREFAEKNTPHIENMVYDSDEASIVDYIADKATQFAKEILSHQWRSVEEELPEDDTLAVVHSPNGRVEVLHYYDDAFQDELKQAHCVDYWMALPEIPSLNPEQR